MRTIMVPARGSEAEASVFETALAAAKPLGAHLDFYHVKMDVGEAAANARYVGFAMGSGLAHALDELQTEQQTRSLAARNLVAKFCHRHDVALLKRPQVRPALSASFSEESGELLPFLLARARHSDLVVLGRPRPDEHLPADLPEYLLLESGRPILLAPLHAVDTLTGTIMVCWKECREAAHALTAAMPLIRRATRVVLASVIEDEPQDTMAAVNGLAAQLRWQGIDAELRCIASGGRTIAAALASAAQECAADLLVMGAYTHSHTREVMFGGCTDAFLRADRAVLLVH